MNLDEKIEAQLMPRLDPVQAISFNDMKRAERESWYIYQSSPVVFLNSYHLIPAWSLLSTSTV